MKAKPYDFVEMHMKKSKMFHELETWMNIFYEFRDDNYLYNFYVSELGNYLKNPKIITKILIRIYVDRMGEMNPQEELAKHVIARMLEERGAFKYEHRRNP